MMLEDLVLEFDMLLVVVMDMNGYTGSIASTA